MTMLRTLWLLFITFFKIGAFTFGGGYAMIQLISENVIQKGWVDNPNMLLDFIGISESTPGPFAINISTFIGYEQAGIWGALVATLGVILPSIIVIIIIAKLFHKFSTNKYVMGFMHGVRPLIVGVIFATGVSLILYFVFNVKLSAITSSGSDTTGGWKAFVIFAVIFGLNFVHKKVNPIYLIILSGILGYVMYGLIG